MDGQRTDAPPKLIERAASAAVAGACGAAIAAAGCYGAVYGLASQTYGFVGSGASVAITVLSFLLLAVAMSVGGGALLRRLWA